MTLYEKDKMVDATMDYCNRVTQISNLNLQNETLALEFEKSDLETLLMLPGTEKLMGVWGTDPNNGKQSIYLIPLDRDGRAVRIDNEVKGAELWGGRPPLATIIGPNQAATLANVEAFYNSL